MTLKFIYHLNDHKNDGQDPLQTEFFCVPINLRKLHYVIPRTIYCFRFISCTTDPLKDSPDCLVLKIFPICTLLNRIRSIPALSYYN